MPERRWWRRGSARPPAAKVDEALRHRELFGAADYPARASVIAPGAAAAGAPPAPTLIISRAPCVRDVGADHHLLPIRTSHGWGLLRLAAATRTGPSGYRGYGAAAVGAPTVRSQMFIVDPIRR